MSKTIIMYTQYQLTTHLYKITKKRETNQYIEFPNIILSNWNARCIRRIEIINS